MTKTGYNDSSNHTDL